MNRAEVIELFIEIKQEYPNFDDSDEEINRHLKYLQDFPFETAMENVVRHIKTNKWPPGIADIRGRLGDQLESQRSKEQAQAYFAKLDAFEANHAPPPEGYWEALRRRLQGGGHE
ncbi:replicative helicase loader/inhibitor [Paenibacillus sp. y28]|uniref:replicative helicase loader/inhibitor n=1 Tax=Paenibacillus sp. y28 TaxID=3129110 RepID=UPI003015F097